MRVSASRILPFYTPSFGAILPDARSYHVKNILKMRCFGKTLAGVNGLKHNAFISGLALLNLDTRLDKCDIFGQ